MCPPTQPSGVTSPQRSEKLRELTTARGERAASHNMRPKNVAARDATPTAAGQKSGVRSPLTDTDRGLDFTDN